MAQIKITITIEATFVRDAHEGLDAMDALLRSRGGRVVNAKLVPVGEQRDADGNKLFSLAKYAYTAKHAKQDDAHLFAEREAFVADQEQEDDLDECADCGGSTADGSPDPHECVSSDAEANQALVAALAALPAYNGWRAEWEYPGYLAFHRKGSPSVLATPDYHKRGQIACEVQYTSGHEMPLDSIAWPRDCRTPEGYMALMRPVLDGIASPIVESSDEIFEAVMAAMQPAEEMGGPEGAQYVALMERIAHEAQRRANNARPREWEVKFNRGHIGVTQIVVAHSSNEAERVFRDRIRSSGEQPVVGPISIEVRS